VLKAILKEAALIKHFTATTASTIDSCN